MAGAWTDGYWLSYTLSGSPRISFEIPFTGSTIWPWKILDASHRFDFIKAQLDTSWVWVEWNDTSKEITRIVALNRY
jgi:hypothetical protein